MRQITLTLSGAPGDIQFIACVINSSCTFTYDLDLSNFFK